MADFLTKEQRSSRMKLIRGKDTKPELLVRRMIWAMGRRYRLHVTALPGRPDLVFAKDKKAIFVHGCFWHLHATCNNYSRPKTRNGYWVLKLSANKSRDRKNLQALHALGWSTLVVWDCQLRDQERIRNRIRKFLFSNDMHEKN